MPLRFGEHTPKQMLAPPSQNALFLSPSKQVDGPTKPWFYLEAVNTGLIVNTGLANSFEFWCKVSQVINLQQGLG